MVHEVHHFLEENLLFFPQLLHSIAECLRASLAIRYTFVPVGDICFVEVACKHRPVDIGHRRHRSDGAPESARLRRRYEVQALVSDAFIGQLCGVIRCANSADES
jgi:hypothetical protein